MKNNFPPKTFWDVDYFVENGVYQWMKPIQQELGNGRVLVEDYGDMILLNSYSYLSLIGHPKINEAAKNAIKKYGTGTNGVRLLAGTTPLHLELEKRIADFKHTDTAITFSSGYVTNLSTISSLMRAGDTVICDKINHASIFDGCALSGAKMVRYNHNDMNHLEHRLKQSENSKNRFVVVDAVFSMDGDVVDLPNVIYLCQKYGAYLMVDEAHSIGVLGKTGHGIEEHFDISPDAIDIKMGTLSKTIPSIGGYVAGSSKFIRFLKHECRSFIFSASLPPSNAAAAKTAFDIIEEEPERVVKLHENTDYFAEKLRNAGFDLLQSTTAVFPIICGDLATTAKMQKHCFENGVFVHGVFPPVVPEGTGRLRVTVTTNHQLSDLDYCVDVLKRGAEKFGVKLSSQ